MEYIFIVAGMLLSMQILAQTGLKEGMKDYQVNYTADDAMLSKLNTYGVDLEKNNGNKDHVLPYQQHQKVVYV